MTSGAPSYSPRQKRRISLHVAISIAAFLAIVVMANYLAARHYVRLPWSTEASHPFSPLTRTILASVTNRVQVTVFFDKDEPIFDSVWSLLKEYKFANPRIMIEAVDYRTDPVAALAIKTKYALNTPVAKNVVIFDCAGRVKTVHENQLSELDIKSFTSGQSSEVRRTHFRGELEFTSALLTVTNPRKLQAYFLRGHGEHDCNSDEKLMGYSRFAGVLRNNNIQYAQLSLQGTNAIPADCHLLIIAGPRAVFLPEELDKVDQYLKQGGRLLVLFNHTSLFKPTGLERLLADWGVEVGRNVVSDKANSIKGQDIILSDFGDHPLMTPLYDQRLHLILARTIAPRKNVAGRAGLQVVPLARSSPSARVITDVTPELVLYPRPKDFVGAVPLMVAVEKGNIRGVSADRGATRIVVTGDSLFLANEMIQSVANRDFATHAVNWLLARHELLVGLVPQPIKEYKLNLTERQMQALRWIFLLGLPGVVLLVGFVVQWRRKS